MKILTGNIFDIEDGNITPIVVVNPLNALSVPNDIACLIRQQSEEAFHASIINAQIAWENTNNLFDINVYPCKTRNIVILNAFVYQAKSNGAPDQHLFTAMLEYTKANFSNCIVRLPYKLGTEMTDDEWTYTICEIYKTLKENNIEIWMSLKSKESDNA
jgi:hypothetical protein